MPEHDFNALRKAQEDLAQKERELKSALECARIWELRAIELWKKVHGDVPPGWMS